MCQGTTSQPAEKLSSVPCSGSAALQRRVQRNYPFDKPTRVCNDLDMMTNTRAVYQLVVGNQKDINSQLSMNETHWKPILLSTFPFEKAVPYGVLFAVIVERVGPEDAG